MNKKWMTASMASLSACLLVGCSNGGAQGKEVASTSAGKITSAQLYDKMKRDNGEEALQFLILQSILEKQVKDPKKIKNEVTAQVAQQVAQYGGNKDLVNAALRQSGIANQKMYEDSLYVAKMMDEYLKGEIKTSDKDLEAYYKNWEPQITASHILVQTEDDAKKIIKELNDGADFAKLAKERSLDTGSARNGGQLKPFKKGQMDPSFEKAAFDLKKEGEITQEPVKSQYGFHIIRLDKKAEKGKFEAIKDQLKQELIADKLKNKAFRQDAVAALVKKSKVKISDNDLKGVMKYFMSTQEQQAAMRKQQEQFKQQQQKAQQQQKDNKK
ncbi:foldase [Atopobacter sp. AH10]|uniref:peptidylprolyl isomerase n=1 Tax=Atopobacter sp. AH10 TaxID=2315861 RepID=UPI000EF221D6|nr:peptidylprolyl isomerase [Atopobacter sp. AH10]RLK63674.1 foldase [Atopobacter sp. AH10]